MIAYPFDSVVTFESNGTPIYDRAVSSAPYRNLLKKLFTTGVAPNPSSSYQVVAATSGMTVNVSPGFAIIEGAMALETAIRTLTVQASTSLDRIDTVVLRMNDNLSARTVDLYVLQGTPATTPVRPALTRNATYYEIGIADLFIAKNTTTITQARITDTRLDSARCGIMSSISQFDTTTLYAQIQSDLAEFKAEEQEDFLVWFDNIKDQLSDDAAGNLQLQIGNLNDLDTANKTDLVVAANELKGDIQELNDSLNDMRIGSSSKVLLNTTGNTTYTATEDCLITVDFAYNSYVSAVVDLLRVNGTQVYFINIPIGYLNHTTTPIPIKKGDVITYSKTAQNIIIRKVSN